MKKDLERLEGLLEALRKHHDEKVRLFLITKHRHEDKAKRNALRQFVFKVWTVDLNRDLNKYFFHLLIRQLEKTVTHKGLEIKEYAVIDDEIDGKIYRYSLSKALAFSDIIINQLSKAHVDIPYVPSLQDIKDNLWAYCISTELEEADYLYSFRKIYKGKIVTDKKDIREKIVCMFDTADSKLKSIEEEVINFDDKLDCICHDGRFYILQKKSFEKLVGMEEEFRQHAEEVIETLKNTNFFVGLDVFSEEVLNNSTLFRKIAHIARRDRFKTLDSTRILQMKKLAKKLELPLKIKGNKLIIEDHKDVGLVLQMLDKYFVACMQTGEVFGSHAKTKINVSNKTR